ncbi:MAG: SAM-dependent methyltransferase [Bacteroidales bacterium]|nr:SAM-dependent methyltransferase [Bacteroidales bacterium]MDY0255207.1 SAM-dependent methyltransferase [Tenuifilaceae bacterium]
MSAKLFLLPTTLGSDSIADVIPEYVLELTRSLEHFVVEDVRTARRYLSKLGMPHPIENLNFFELNEHSTFQEIQGLISPLLNGISVGLMSEAGVPAVADPGAQLVLLAHQKGVRVVPLVGPSSMVLALMGSGMNGQNFAFVGYLPIKPNDRVKRIKQLEQRSREEKQSQFFIETPYRNNKLLESLASTLHPDTLVHISTDLTMPTELVITKRAKELKSKMPDLHKRPSIFGIQSY